MNATSCAKVFARFCGSPNSETELWQLPSWHPVRHGVWGQRLAVGLMLRRRVILGGVAARLVVAACTELPELPGLSLPSSLRSLTFPLSWDPLLAAQPCRQCDSFMCFGSGGDALPCTLSLRHEIYVGGAGITGLPQCHLHFGLHFLRPSAGGWRWLSSQTYQIG